MDLAGLKDPGTIERFQPAGPPWIGSGGARRGLLAWQTRLAIVPFHLPGLLTHGWRCSEPSWGKFLENLPVKIWMVLCEVDLIRNCEETSPTRSPSPFMEREELNCFLIFGEPCAGVHAFWR